MKKVAIVGFATTRDMAPFTDPEFEIWTVNNLYSAVPRTDRIFQLHHPRHLMSDAHGVAAEDHIKFLQETDIPIYMQEKYEDIPASVRFPLEELTAEFGLPRADGTGIDGYWTNSISFMIALAIYEGFDVIHVYGVDMAVNTEYNEQRPSCEYYLGIAKGRGIELYLPPQSDLLKTRFVYGYEEEIKSAWELKLEKTVAGMMERKTQSDAVIRNQKSVSDKYEGAVQALLEMQRTWQ